MHVALIISGSLVAVGAILYLHHRLTEGRVNSSRDENNHIPSANTNTASETGEECCGMHITCERDSLSPVFADEATLYFDDDELDAYRGRPSHAYTEDEIEQFRDVLLTLRPDDIAPWARAIQTRGIELPNPVRDELFIIVADARAARLKN